MLKLLFNLFLFFYDHDSLVVRVKITKRNETTVFLLLFLASKFVKIQLIRQQICLF